MTGVVMNEDFKNIKSWANTVDSWLGTLSSLAGSVTGLFILSLVPICLLWGVLWVLNEMGIV